MKKLLCVAIAFATLLMVNGCESKNNNDVFEMLNKEQNTKKDQVILSGKSASYSKTNDVKCDELKNAVVAYNNYFITADETSMRTNKIYKYNFQLLFENDKNCILVHSEDNKDFKSLLGFGNNSVSNETIIAMTSQMSEKTIRYYGGEPQLPIYYSVNLGEPLLSTAFISYYTIDSFSNYRLNKSDELVQNPSVIYQLVNDRVIISNNKIYKVDLVKSYLFIYDVELTNEIIFEPLEDEETILKVFEYAIITDKRVYVYGMSNDNCLHYVDGKCEYGYVVNEDLTNRIDDIVFVNSNEIVFKDGSAYLYNAWGEE